jgi:prepilin-type N-terminal cleavage/methylation domain-containing protein/prepilin-type processing-associated H-X9-DG protein
MKRNESSSVPDARGFTLIELITIIAVVAVLSAVCLTALANAKSQTKIAQCASNLRQFGVAMQIYAGEFNDRLPSSNYGFYMSDLDVSVADFMVRLNTNFQKSCYCPGTAPRFSDADNLRLWMWGGGSYRTLGYAMTLPNSSALLGTNSNPTLTPQTMTFGPVVQPPPILSQRVLLADETLSLTTQHNPSQRDTYEYVNITGGSYPVPLISAHLNGRLPVGGNLTMLDGHVEWRKFENMTVRGYGGAGGGRDNGTSPTFWW